MLGCISWLIFIMKCKYKCRNGKEVHEYWRMHYQTVMYVSIIYHLPASGGLEVYDWRGGRHPLRLLSIAPSLHQHDKGWTPPFMPRMPWFVHVLQLLVIARRKVAFVTLLTPFSSYIVVTLGNSRQRLSSCAYHTPIDS